MVIRMPKHAVQIGKITLESNLDFSWDDILRLAKELKKIANWDPENKKWVLNWRFISLRDKTKEILSMIKNIDLKYGISMENMLKKLLESIPTYLISANYVLFLPINIDPYSISKALNDIKIPVNVEYRDLKLEEFGDFKVPYIAIPIDVFKMEKDRIKSYLPPDLQRIINSIDESRLKSKIRAYPISPRKIIVELGAINNPQLERDLLSLGQIRIFVEDPVSGFKERTYKLYKKIMGQGNFTKIILPSYAIGLVEKIAKRYGFEVDINYGIEFVEIRFMNPRINLLTHQREALESWINSGRRGTIVIPTGGGKTHIALAAIADLKLPTLILVPNKWLLKQWAERIAMFLGIPIGMIGQFGGGERKIREITVATYQSAYKYVDDLTNRFVFVVFDEAHHVPARTFKNIALYLRAIYRMALSATPERRDRNEILLFKLVGDIVYEIGLRELVERGILAPLAVRKIYVRLPIDESIIYRRYERLMYGSRTEFEKRKYLNKLIEITRDNPEKLKAIREIVKKHLDEKIFIFAGSIKFAEEIEKSIRDIIPTALLTSKTKKSMEERIIKSFQSGVIRCLVLVKKGEEGVDVGDASVAIIAGGSKQERELIQRVGRILRGKDNKLAWLYEVVTKDTVDEMLSKARNIRRFVMEIEDIVRKKYGVKAFEIKFY